MGIDIDNTQPEGENPIGDVAVKYLGEQNDHKYCSHRDLGFAGCIQGKWYALYGDTLWCHHGLTDHPHEPDQFHGMARNAVSALTDDPLVVKDIHVDTDGDKQFQKQFVPFKEEWGETNTFGFGGTSIVETDGKGTAAMYILINNNEDYAHAGIVKIKVVDGKPTVVERVGDSGWWWDTSKTAMFGDIAAYRDEHSDYIYALGHPPKTVTEWPAKDYVYQARVKAQDAFDLDKYEYWWGRQQGWKKEVLSDFTAETAVMWGVGQGQIVYSNYFKTYLYVHLAGPKVAFKTAPKPEGPWSAAKEVYEAEPLEGGFVYAGVAYPFLDESGKTLTVAFTNKNHIQVIRVAFEGSADQHGDDKLGCRGRAKDDGEGESEGKGRKRDFFKKLLHN